jgi:hypothetical protein
MLASPNRLRLDRERYNICGLAGGPPTTPRSADKNIDFNFRTIRRSGSTALMTEPW